MMSLCVREHERKVKRGRKNGGSQCDAKTEEGDRKKMIWFGGVGFLSIDFLWILVIIFNFPPS